MIYQQDMMKMMEESAKKLKIGSQKRKGRPTKRWKDDVVETGSIFWKRKARNRKN